MQQKFLKEVNELDVKNDETVSEYQESAILNGLRYLQLFLLQMIPSAFLLSNDHFKSQSLFCLITFVYVIINQPKSLLNMIAILISSLINQ